MNSKMNRNWQGSSFVFRKKEKKKPRKNSWFGANSLKSSENFNAENIVFKSCRQLERFLLLFRQLGLLQKHKFLRAARMTDEDSVSGSRHYGNRQVHSSTSE